MKYYVRTGDFKFIIDRPSEYEAAFYGLKNALIRDEQEKKNVGLITVVREDRFPEPTDDIDLIGDDSIILTERLLIDMGIADYFEFKKEKYDALISRMKEFDPEGAMFIKKMIDHLGKRD